MVRTLRRRFAFLSGITFLAAVAPVSAQTIVNPTAATFRASADHSATYSDGTPVVQRYEMDFYLSGASAPIQTVSIGKPTPDGTGRSTSVWHPCSARRWRRGRFTPLTSQLLDLGDAARVSVSPDSFAFASCTVGVSQLNASMPAAGGTVSRVRDGKPGLRVDGDHQCHVARYYEWWNWLGQRQRDDDGRRQLRAHFAERHDECRGPTVTVTQAAACGYAASPSTVKMTTTGSPSSVTITAPAGCAWSATSNAAWLTVAGGPGSGNGSITLSATPNTAVKARTTTVTVGGQTVSVTEAGSRGKNR